MSNEHCFECNQFGHYAHSCPYRQWVPPQANGESHPPEPEPATVRYVNGNTDAYLPLKVNEISTMAFIDTGSAKSIVPASMVRPEDVAGLRTDRTLRCWCRQIYDVEPPTTTLMSNASSQRNCQRWFSAWTGWWSNKLHWTVRITVYWFKVVPSRFTVNVTLETLENVGKTVLLMTWKQRTT